MENGISFVQNKHFLSETWNIYWIWWHVRESGFFSRYNSSINFFPVFRLSFSQKQNFDEDLKVKQNPECLFSNVHTNYIAL